MIYQETTPILPVEISDIKTHLRISHSFEDKLITQYAYSACINAEHIMMREIIYRKDEKALAKSADDVPANVKQYIFCAVGDLYAYRELSTTTALTTHYKHLLDPYILYDRAEE